jgi:hypothetical protein
MTISRSPATTFGTVSVVGHVVKLEALPRKAAPTKTDCKGAMRSFSLKREIVRTLKRGFQSVSSSVQENDVVRSVASG